MKAVAARKAPWGSAASGGQRFREKGSGPVRAAPARPVQQAKRTASDLPYQYMACSRPTRPPTTYKKKSPCVPYWADNSIARWQEMAADADGADASPPIATAAAANAATPNIV